MVREGVADVAGGENTGLGMVKVLASSAEVLGDAPTRDWHICRCYTRLVYSGMQQHFSGGMYVPCRGPIRFDIREEASPGPRDRRRKLVVQHSHHCHGRASGMFTSLTSTHNIMVCHQAGGIWLFEKPLLKFAPPLRSFSTPSTGHACVPKDMIHYYLPLQIRSRSAGHYYMYTPLFLPSFLRASMPHHYTSRQAALGSQRGRRTYTRMLLIGI